ncbi:MAG: hypothetical protein COA90_06920 [Gammaproteobacteria bacterium]|nr:MAG: hypothetical protein COA90_06920 [Gammaproteobacteria bacterium]
MNIELLIILVLFLTFAFVLLQAIFMVQENQRLVVLRMGKLLKVVGSGFSMVIPFVDAGIVVDLSTHLPNWQQLTEEDLAKHLINLVKNDPDPTAYK